MPGEDKNLVFEPGFYGKGISATDNIFYASFFGNSCRPLGINEKTYILSYSIQFNF